MNTIILNEIKRLLETDQWQRAVELSLEQEIVPQQEKFFLPWSVSHRPK